MSRTKQRSLSLTTDASLCPSVDSAFGRRRQSRQLFKNILLYGPGINNRYSLPEHCQLELGDSRRARPLAPEDL